ncbi:MAG TPA: hypothetical protein VLG12_08655 [Candidatus Saccharimonadales bacterium]|nr:hypothetical protein [Candidatus Saccharimonadales bacterium]
MAFQENMHFQPCLAPKFRPGDRVSYSGNGDDPFYFDVKGNQTMNTNASRIDPRTSWIVKDIDFIIEEIEDEDNIREVITTIIIVDHYGYDVRIKEEYIVGY